MGKKSESRTKDYKDGDTKILFKKSNATMFSHSRTCSGASQLYSRSGIMQIRNNLENNQHHYYTDRGKVKRDLSVETDICILRRYYRKKKNSLFGTNTAKSRYSTECETIEEYPDTTSACGDNDTDKSNLPLDIASLMIDNLKDLLNQWIQKHLIENKATKQKIDTVLDSLIQKLERSNLPSSSGSTYILHKEAGKQEVKNKKVATASLTCQYCKQRPHFVNVTSSAAESNITENKSSVLTTPFHYKDIKIISTLSIPRSFHKRGLEDDNEHNSSWYRMKKMMKHKNLILSIDKSNKFIDSSSYDLVTISTKSLNKKSINNDTISKKKKRHIVFFPKPFYKSATDTSSMAYKEKAKLKLNNINIDEDQLEAMPSLLKSLYANETIMSDKNNQHCTKNNNYTMTDNNYNEITISNAAVTTDVPRVIFAKQTTEKCTTEANDKPFVAMDFTNRRIAYPNPYKSSLEQPKNSKININNGPKNTSNRGRINKPRKRLKYPNTGNKQFTFLYKKANRPTSPGGVLLKHCQNVIHYFEEYQNKNIKLDVQINVYPTSECKTKDVCTDVSNQTLGTYIQINPTLLYNMQPTKIDATVHMDEEESIKCNSENENSSSECPEIIPLLDSTVCQANFILNMNSKEKFGPDSKPNIYVERSTLTSELEIVQEISELRAVIKDLAAAAEKFVNEQLRRESYKSNAETNISHNPSNYTSSSKIEAVINLRNPSKAIQYSKEIIEKQKLLSGLKITKEPKKKETFDFYNRLAKKSTSYRIIESESILRVTDMTSKAIELNETPDHRDNLDTKDIRNSKLNRVTKEPLPKSLKKSKSMFEVTTDRKNKKKLIALFCNGYSKNPQCRVCNVHRKHSPSSCSDKSCRQFRKLFAWAKKKDEALIDQEESKLPCVCVSGTNNTDSLPTLKQKIRNSLVSSTVIFRPDDTELNAMNESGEDELSGTLNSMEMDQEQMRLQKCCKQRRGMGFGEGCVYCVLLWIPILLLATLFYVYVLKNKYSDPNAMAIERQGRIPLSRRNNASAFYVKLSDLGF